MARHERNRIEAIMLPDGKPKQSKLTITERRQAQADGYRLALAWAMQDVDAARKEHTRHRTPQLWDHQVDEHKGKVQESDEEDKIHISTPVLFVSKIGVVGWRADDSVDPTKDKGNTGTYEDEVKLEQIFEHFGSVARVDLGD
eukprot:COSAG05_NODE_13489_length_428_cov_0.720365_1_plen_142_part_11